MKNINDIRTYEELATDLKSAGFDLSLTPVKVEEIAKIYGIAIDDSYRVEQSNEIASVQGLNIWINPEDANEYTSLRRHIVAHELGHIVLHKPENGNPLNFQDSSEDLRGKNGTFDPKEEECNVFAAELLIPLKPLIALISEELDNLPSMDKITNRVAEVFDVPRSLVMRRLSIIAGKGKKS